MTGMLNHPDQSAALEQLAGAMDAMNPVARLQFAQATLRAVRDNNPPQAAPLWSALHLLTESTDADRLGHLLSVLEVVGPAPRAALKTVADHATQADMPRAAVWRALSALVSAIDG